MEWSGAGGGRAQGGERGAADPPASSSGSSGVPPPHLRQAGPCPPACGPFSAGALTSLCQSQQRRVRASVATGWSLAEAQHRLGSLGLHGSESLEQERARASAASWDVFDKSIINAPQTSSEHQDKTQSFIQTNENELRHFGMLRRWDDSQRFLAERPLLICEETANHLVLWCFRLQHEGKEALMEQVAHQAVAMQFILEMASTSQQDPRGCFRLFFQKAKAGQDGYLDVFLTELEAFKRRVTEYTVRSRGAAAPKDGGHQSVGAGGRLDPQEVLESLPPELKTGFQLQDMQILQNVLSTMNPQVAEYHVKRCLEAGLWSHKEADLGEAAATDEAARMMEMS
ncbi:hypothetical protein NHX12_027342 [Muraenolepis orangiensis]|uniref:Hsp90 co-chaperone Cdc37-like 1 n=1 Tax=Muraenolepis orangiensis TaxID=630683 RepID=A0A9Q0IP47_9TELE|nr:hypothetical protein NHX12_027342 [Muraenolepis orangiensis]